MWFSKVLICATLALGTFVSALPHEGKKDKRSFVERDGVKYTVFEHAATGAKIEFVTNSGICETTPGVNQYSGYLTVGTGMNMWFWFFESRNSPTTAPLAMWLNGGPGCSSMIGLFQENGPCQFYNGASTPSLNPYSFNEYANMLYVDQPIGTGFSYGTDDATGTVTAAPYVWTLLQAFYAQFPQYESRQFGLWTESYGGHYGPEFAEYFETQNAAIAAGTITGNNIDLVALGINNGWYDPTLQFKAYIDYSYNNTYKPLITLSQYNSITASYNKNCLPALEKCTGTTGTNSACETADNTCVNDIEEATDVENFDPYDIREPSNDPYPPETYVNYLTTASVVKAIGAKASYVECANAPYDKFENTGDDARSFTSKLSTLLQTSTVQVLLWAGDADWVCNWFGGLAVANSIQYSGTTAFNAATAEPYTVSGTSMGTFKNVGKLSWLRVFAAGHEVPYYQPAVALQVFKQTMMGQGIAPTK